MRPVTASRGMMSFVLRPASVAQFLCSDLLYNPELPSIIQYEV